MHWPFSPWGSAGTVGNTNDWIHCSQDTDLSPHKAVEQRWLANIGVPCAQHQTQCHSLKTGLNGCGHLEVCLFLVNGCGHLEVCLFLVNGCSHLEVCLFFLFVKEFCPWLSIEGITLAALSKKPTNHKTLWRCHCWNSTSLRKSRTLKDCGNPVFNSTLTWPAQHFSVLWLAKPPIHSGGFVYRWVTPLLIFKSIMCSALSLRYHTTEMTACIVITLCIRQPFSHSCSCTEMILLHSTVPAVKLGCSDSHRTNDS